MEENNYATKTVNVYDLDTCLKIKNSLQNFNLENCLLDAINIVKNSDKGTYVYTGYKIAFDGTGLWSFGNDFAWKVGIFGVNNNSSSSSHAENRKE